MLTVRIVLCACVVCLHMRMDLTQTAGVDVCVAKVDIPDTAMKTLVELYLYDTGGNDIFVEDTKKHVRRSLNASQSERCHEGGACRL